MQNIVNFRRKKLVRQNWLDKIHNNKFKHLHLKLNFEKY